MPHTGRVSLTVQLTINLSPNFSAIWSEQTEKNREQTGDNEAKKANLPQWESGAGKNYVLSIIDFTTD